MSPAPRLAGIYPETYDVIYAGKDYEREADCIEEAFRRHGAGGAFRSILDLGCGTGGHALVLAGRGYEVTGIDASADMVALASRKAEKLGSTGHFLQGDMRTSDLGRTFDAVLIMFSALGYQTTNEEVARVFQTVRRHLRPGGLLVMDVWYGPTVLRQGPLERFRVIVDGDRQILRASTPSMQADMHVMDVRVRIWDIVGSRLQGAADEIHRVRFFFPRELEVLVSGAGMRCRAFFEFPEMDQPPRESTWDLGCVAAAV